ncbi:MAG: cupredoxin domain-containing protein [Nanoarchaeota archaeon]|nr:cupredoxin domain-containing protein [Nanoarchaeota archaeon]
MKKTVLYAMLTLVLLVLGGLFFISNGKGTSAGNAVSDLNTGSVQKITLSMKNGNYYPQEIRVNVNQPVEIYLDGSVTGCFRDFTIREFGIHQYLGTPQDKVTFTPTKTGTFIFACSMSMGTGKIIVE